MEVASSDLLRGQSPALKSLTKTAEVMTAAITLPPKVARFAGDFRPDPCDHATSIRYISYCGCLWALMPISSQDLVVFFCGFGVALVALNLYKLAQPAKG